MLSQAVPVVPVLQGSAVAPSGTSTLAAARLQLSGGEGNSFSLSPVLYFLFQKSVGKCNFNAKYVESYLRQRWQ